MPPRKVVASAGTPTAESVVATLRKMGTTAVREGMARYAIPSDKAFGVSVGAMKTLAKRIGHDHDLAAYLWETGWYEARMIACFLDDPARVTPAQMDRWSKDFDSWAICDHACFHLFDRTPHAWTKIKQWATRKEEFVKRAAFALLASVALHDKTAADDLFVGALPLMEKASADDRNFVKKGVSWALRAYAKRSPPVRSAAVAVAQKLAASDVPSTRWIGKDALRDLTKPPSKRSVR